MTSNSGRDIEIFTEAAQLPLEDRADFLRSACGADEILRKKIEALLKSNDRAGAFLESPPTVAIGGGRTKAFAGGEKPGDFVGRYKLLQLIGEGGCGVVFAAEQEKPVARRVALKIVKPGMDTKSVIARFEAERQALALMDHPNIAHVFDAGTTEGGRPYFVMELVDGVKITDYCTQHSLGIHPRLELFVQVCGAIQHAHQKGIIHRDIKPSNILVKTGVDGNPAPKVIDFGIAKAISGQRLTDKTLFTAAEMLIGTPAYMSPEQAALASVDVDTRTDIYSLGVLLYELLTGTTPFDTRELLKLGLDELRRVIQNDEPVRPSTRLSKITSEQPLSNSKHPAYSAPKLIREISGDIDWIVMKSLEKDRARRYATANGFAMDISRYLSGEVILARPPNKWYRFRKLAERNRLLFGSLSMVAAIIVIGLITVTVFLTKEQAARREAEKSRRQAEADKISSEQVSRFLEEMLDGVAPSAALGRDTTMLREILDKTADRLAIKLTNQPAVQADLCVRLGKVYSDLGRHEQAEMMFRAALAIQTKLFGEENAATSDLLYELGDELNLQSKETEAENYIRRALALRLKLFGENSIKVAECYESLGAIFWDRKQVKETEEILRKSLAIHIQVSGDNSPESGESRVGLSSVLCAQAKYHEAEELLRQAMRNWEKVLNELHPSIIRCVNNLAVVLAIEGKDAEAEPLLQRAVSIRRKLYPDGHPTVSSSLQNLARVQMRLNSFEEAEINCREALAVARKVAGDNRPQVLDVLQDLLRVMLHQRKSGQIEELFSDLLPPLKDLKSSHAGLLLARTEAYARSGRWREAVGDARALLQLDNNNHESYHTLVPLLVQLGDLAEYQKLCSTIMRKFSGATEPVVADRMSKDCLILASSGVDLIAAAALADVTVNRGLNENTSPYFKFCKSLAEFRVGHYEDAAQWARSVGNSFLYPKACASAILAMSQFKLDQFDEAIAALSKCNQIIQQQLPALGEDLSTDWRDWIIAHALQSEANRMIDTEFSLDASPPNFPR